MHSLDSIYLAVTSTVRKSVDAPAAGFSKKASWRITEILHGGNRRFVHKMILDVVVTSCHDFVHDNICGRGQYVVVHSN